MKTSYSPHERSKKTGGITQAVTVRVSGARLRRVMRGRHIATQSELINVLLSEAEERLRAQRVLKQTAATAGPDDLDDRLL